MDENKYVRRIGKKGLALDYTGTALGERIILEEKHDGNGRFTETGMEFLSRYQKYTLFEFLNSDYDLCFIGGFFNRHCCILGDDYRKWSEEDMKYLLGYWKTSPFVNIVARLNRTPLAICQKLAELLGIEYNKTKITRNVDKRRELKVDEEQILKNLEGNDKIVENLRSNLDELRMDGLLNGKFYSFEEKEEYYGKNSDNRYAHIYHGGTDHELVISIKKQNVAKLITFDDEYSWDEFLEFIALILRSRRCKGNVETSTEKSSTNDERVDL